MKKLLIALLIIVGNFASGNTLQAATSDNAKFISISDIHFDPFSACSMFQKPCLSVTKLREADAQNWHRVFEQYGDKGLSPIFHNTNYGLLQFVLIKLKETNEKEKPHFVIILGDFLAHHYKEQYVKYSGDKSQKGYEDFVKKTLQFLTKELAATFPNVDIFPVIGNNDSYTGDYGVLPGGKFFQDTAVTWSSFIKDKENRQRFLRDFPTAGYYVVTLPMSKNQKLIVLNSVLFSGRIHKNAVTKAAERQLKWLHQQLELTTKNHERAFIADHIPLGIDAYATAISKFQQVKQFWQPTYTKQLTEEIEPLSKTITGIFSGHVHVVAFQMMMDKEIGHTPVYFTPSISPIYGNNPGFKIYHYSPQTLSIEDSIMFYYPLDQRAAEWKTLN